MDLPFLRSRIAIFCLFFGLVGCDPSPQGKATRFITRGDRYLTAKDYNRALLEYQNAIQATPNDAKPYFQKGLAYLGAGDIQNAVVMFQRTLELNPTHNGAKTKLGELMTLSPDEKTIREGMGMLTSLYGESPNNPEALTALAIAEWRLGKPELAAERLEAALKKFPRFLASSMTLSRMKMLKNDLPGAEQVLLKAVEESPRSMVPLLALAEFYSYTNQPAKGEPFMRRALELDPKHVPALTGLASILYATSRLDEAGQIYQRLSELGQDDLAPLHAMFLYDTGKRSEGVTELQALVKAKPRLRAARSALVTMLLGMKRDAEAEQVLTAALAKNPHDTDALIQRAQMRLTAGKFAEADTDANEVLHSTPDSPMAHVVMAAVHQAMGRTRQQQQELQSALSYKPDFLGARIALAYSYLQEKQAQTALTLLEMIPESQTERPEWLRARNWAWLWLGRSADAKPVVDKLLQRGRAPEDVFQKALVQFIDHDYVGSRASVEELIQHDIVAPDVIQLLMQTYVATKTTNQGIARIEKLAQSKPQTASLQLVLGQWYKGTGNTAGARQAYEKAKAVDPQLEGAELALAQMDIESGNLNAARTRLKSVIAATPTNLPALLLSARVDLDAGDHQAAANTYREAVKLAPSDVVAVNNLAYELALINSDDALQFAQRAAELAPDSATVQDTLGMIYYRKGIYRMAVQYLEAAVKKEPSAKRQFHLGLCYIKSGEKAKGQAYIEQALARDPGLAKAEATW
jgi:tetratricopeptide (TPR) repeat protein